MEMLPISCSMRYCRADCCESLAADVVDQHYVLRHPARFVVLHGVRVRLIFSFPGFFALKMGETLNPQS